MALKQIKGTWRTGMVFGLPAVMLTLGGCTDNSPSDNNNNEPPGKGAPVYAFETFVYTPDLSSNTEYISFAQSSKADTQIDESKSIEVKGRNATIWKLPKPGEF